MGDQSLNDRLFSQFIKVVLLRYGFNIIINSVIRDKTVLFESVRSLCESFLFYGRVQKWKLTKFKKKLLHRYNDIKKILEDKFIDKFQNLKSIYPTNFCEQILSPWNLLNDSKTSNLETLFPYLNTALDIFRNSCYSNKFRGLALC